MPLRIAIGVAAALAAAAMVAQQARKPIAERESPPGFDDTPYLPGQKWRVHDIARPHPRTVTPGATTAAPPSDAIVLFDGKDLSHWQQRNRRQRGEFSEPRWKLAGGYVETAPGSGDLVSKEKFGDAQYHIEWSAPPDVQGHGQWRSNSGILLMSHYEIQVLDSYRNETYADGYAGAIYGQWPPLVNPCRQPGEWQSYDILFEAPRFEGDKLVKPAYATVIFNGVVVHQHQEIIGAVAYRAVGRYRPHAAEEPLALQDHDVPVRFRNIWVRRLTGYDQP